VSRYTVYVNREEGQWVATWDGRSTFASTIRALDQAAREVIVLAQDLPDEAAAGLDIDLVVIDEQATTTALYAARDARLNLRHAAADAERRTAAAVRALLGDGVSTRDAAFLLGISHQRVSQIASA
jgi:DNA-directed RNA polymerase specialized sigma24 family protein